MSHYDLAGPWEVSRRWDARMRGEGVTAMLMVYGSPGGWWWRVETVDGATGYQLREMDGRKTTVRAAKAAALAAADEMLAHAVAARGGA